MTVLKVPPVSISMEQVKVVRWLKADGARVNRGERLVEVETDKALVEIESPCDGILHRNVREGMLVDAADALAEILPPGRAPSRAPAARMTKPRVKLRSAGPADPERSASSPAARRLAREKGIDLREVRGSGPQGRIVTADVERFVEEREETDRR